MPINIYSYATGTVEKIARGEIKRDDLPKKGIDFTSLIVGDQRDILFPTIVGIYQKDIPKGAKTEEQEKRFNEALLQCTNAMIEVKWGGKDPVHQDLILIAYNTREIPRDLIVEGLRDRFRRIAIHDIESVPNVYEKDTRGLFSFFSKDIHKLERCFERGEYEKGEYEKGLAILERLAPETEKWLHTMKKYGLNRDEWSSLITMLPPQRIPSF